MGTSQNGSANHWSGTFQRLRAECVILSIILVAYTQLEVKLSKLPLIGLEFARPVPKGPLLAFLYLFFIYFLCAWAVRYQREKLELLSDRNKLNSLLESIQAGRSYAEGFSVSDAKALAITLDKVPKTLEDLRICAERFNQLTSGDIQENLLPAHPGTVGETPPAEEMKKLIDRMRFSAMETPARIREIEHHMSSISKDVTSSWEDRIESFHKTLKEWNSILIEHVNQLQKLRTSIYQDLIVFGFYAPITLSFALFIYSLPQGIIDMRPAVTKLASCLENPQPECFMRAESSIDADMILKSPPRELILP